MKRKRVKGNHYMCWKISYYRTTGGVFSTSDFYQMCLCYQKLEISNFKESASNVQLPDWLRQ